MKLKERRCESYKNDLPQNEKELWGQVLDAWEDLSQDVVCFNELLDSMPRKIRAVVEAEG